MAGARGDIFTYDVRDNLDGDLEGRLTKAVPSAKVSAVLGPWYRTELFANFGTGFHSNDARAVVQDPALTALPQALGWEVGFKSQVLKNVEFSGTFWQLDLDSELVFVGDEGTVEPRGPSRRRGIEVAGRWQALEWLLLTGDVTMTQARFRNGDAVPLAPRFTARGDVTVRFPWGLSASLAVRYLANRYLTEDRQEKAHGYTLLDFTARYRLGPVEAFLTIENLTEHRVPRGPVLLHVAPARRARGGRRRPALHAGEPAERARGPRASGSERDAAARRSAQGAGRRIPSFFIRWRSVLGRSPRRSAASPGPSIFQWQRSTTCRMW